MRILYVATDQIVPGTKGGSIHVMAVASGLAALGHDVQVMVGVDPAAPPPSGSVRWHPLTPPMGIRQLRFLRASAVRRAAAAFRPDIVMERYYNFGGEGMAAAKERRIPYVLEVNAPIIDYPGSPKRMLDRLTIVEPMRRWRERQCAAAALVITPSASIVPASVPPARMLEIEWGADTVRFRPDAAGPPAYSRTPDEVVAVFAGAFRRWHGAVHLVDAIRRLHARGRRHVRAILIGDGPELATVMQAARGLEGITFTGALAHDRMPAALAAADIGVAPFDTAAHAPLALDFYWSPLKVFEYMATGLPVVAPDIARLRHIVRHQQEAWLYDPASPDALADALQRLADDELLRRQLGRAGRDRVVTHFGWDVHCRELERALRQCVS